MYVFWGITVLSLFMLAFGDDGEYAYQRGYSAFSGAILFTGLHLIFRRGILDGLYLIFWEP